MKIVKIAFILLILLFIVGCNDTQTQNTGNSNTKTGTDSGASSDFMKLLSGKKRLEWKVSYDVVTKTNKETMSMKMAQSMKGEKKFRMDSQFNGVESRTYMVDDTVSVCTNNNGWTCMQMKTQDMGETEKAEQDIETNPDNYDIASDGTKAVAGTTAKCYKVIDATNSLTARYCFSSEGVPLYVNIESNQFSTEMTATSYSKTVPESDFVLPAKPTEIKMPAMTGAGQAGNNPCMACDYLEGEQKTECLADC